jgi:hypothetical protein
VIIRRAENCDRKKKFWRHVDRRKKRDREKKGIQIEGTYFHEGNTEEENKGYVVFK